MPQRLSAHQDGWAFRLTARTGRSYRRMPRDQGASSARIDAQPSRQRPTPRKTGHRRRRPPKPSSGFPDTLNWAALPRSIQGLPVRPIDAILAACPPHETVEAQLGTWGSASRRVRAASRSAAEGYPQLPVPSRLRAAFEQLNNLSRNWACCSSILPARAPARAAQHSTLLRTARYLTPALMVAGPATACTSSPAATD